MISPSARLWVLFSIATSSTLYIQFSISTGDDIDGYLPIMEVTQNINDLLVPTRTCPNSLNTESVHSYFAYQSVDTHNFVTMSGTGGDDSLNFNTIDSNRSYSVFTNPTFIRSTPPAGQAYYTTPGYISSNHKLSFDSGSMR